VRHQGRGCRPDRGGCIAAFLGSDHGFSEAIIAEPTRCEAVLAHRGISSVLMKFKGEAGHASGANAMTASALHQAMRWGGNALDLVEGEAHARFGGLTGLRFNIGKVEGGIKANMIAPSAEVRFGFRPLPSQDIDALHAAFRRGLRDRRRAGTLRGNLPRPVAAGRRRGDAEERRLLARDLADELGLPIGNAVDFWTEASLFSQAGLTALVYGPGDIAQAHTADEFVTLDSCSVTPIPSPESLEPPRRDADVDHECHPRPADPPDHRAPALEHGQRQGNQPVPQALFAAGRGALRDRQGRRRGAARRPRRAGVVAGLPAGRGADPDRHPRRRVRSSTRSCPPPASSSRPSTGCG
jgi:hypothetical protein